MSSRTSSPAKSGFGAERDFLFRRFEATIRLKRLVVVTYSEYRFKDHGAVYQITGVPYKNLSAVLWLKRWDGSLVPVIKAFVRNIEGVPTVTLHEPSTDKPPLVFGDPKFLRFITAIGAAERVRVEYLQKLADDPALASLNQRGLPTFTEGVAYGLSKEWLTLQLDNEPSGEKYSIPPGTILDITFMGPNEVEADPPDSLI
jgi:hypothetical protein